jgi:hypothetical protein
MTCDKGTGTWALLKKVYVTMTFIRLLVVCTAQRKESIPRLEYFWLPFNRWEGCSDQHSSPWKCEYQSCRPQFLSIRASQNTVGISDKTEEGISVVRWKLTNCLFQLQQAWTHWMNVLGVVPGVMQGGPIFWECMNHVLDLNAGMGSMLNCLLFSMKVQMLHMHKSRNWEFTIAVNLAS